jgi:hypothetical protein
MAVTDTHDHAQRAGRAAQPHRASGDGYGPELLDEITVRKVVRIAPPQADRR